MPTILSTWEWTLLWSSLEVFITLDESDSEYWIKSFIKYDENRLSIDQRAVLQETIQSWLDGEPNLNTKHMWYKLMSYLDLGNRYWITTLNDGHVRQQICFNHKGTWMPIDKYLSNFTEEWMVIPESITNIRQSALLN